MGRVCKRWSICAARSQATRLRCEGWPVAKATRQHSSQTPQQRSENLDGNRDIRFARLLKARGDGTNLIRTATTIQSPRESEWAGHAKTLQIVTTFRQHQCLKLVARWQSNRLREQFAMIAEIAGR